jgi:hypothetical protein
MTLKAFGSVGVFSEDFRVGNTGAAFNLGNSICRGNLARATLTTNPTGTTSATLADITGLSVTISGIASRTYKVSFAFRGVQSTVAAATETVQLALVVGSTVIADVYVNCGSVASSARNGGTLTGLYIPGSTASFTAKVQMARPAGTGTVLVAAAATSPLTLFVEDLGQW